MHRVGFAQLNEGQSPDCLAVRSSRLHARAHGERRDLPEPAGVVGVKAGNGERHELRAQNAAARHRERSFANMRNS